MFDNPQVRGLYSSLSGDWVYLNAHVFPLVPERVSAAVARSFRVASLMESFAEDSADAGHSSRHSSSARRRRIGESFSDAARTAVADLTGASRDCVVLGPSRAVLLDRLSGLLSRRLTLGQEIVVTRVDDPENIEPWRGAADLYGARLRWAEPDLGTGFLPTWQFVELVGERTAVVSVAAANRYLGTVTDVRAIAGVVRSRSNALLIADVTALVPFQAVDIAALGVDVLALDVDALGGPKIGALVFRDAGVVESMTMRSWGSVGGGEAGDGRAAAIEAMRRRFEAGGVSEGLLGGVPAAVEHLGELDDEASGTRRRRIRQALPQATAYMGRLAKQMVDGLEALGNVQVIGLDSSVPSAGLEFGEGYRVPRVSFLVAGVSVDTVERRLLDNGVVVDVVRPGQSELFEQMGVFEEVRNRSFSFESFATGASACAGGAASGGSAHAAGAGAANGPGAEDTPLVFDGSGAISIGFAPHNTGHDVEQLLRVVASFR